MRKDWNKTFNVDYSLRPFRQFITYYISKKNIILLFAAVLMLVFAVSLINYHATQYRVVGRVDVPPSSVLSDKYSHVVSSPEEFDMFQRLFVDKAFNKPLMYIAQPLRVPALSSFSRAIGYLFPSFRNALMHMKGGTYSWGNDRFIFKHIELLQSFNPRHIKFTVNDDEHYTVSYKHGAKWVRSSFTVGGDVCIPNKEHPLVRLNVLSIHSRPGVSFYLKPSSKTVVDSNRLAQVTFHQLNNKTYFTLHSTHPEHDTVWMRDYLKEVVLYYKADLLAQVDGVLSQYYRNYSYDSLSSARTVEASSMSVSTMHSPQVALDKFSPEVTALLNAKRELQAGGLWKESIKMEPLYTQWTLITTLVFAFISIALLACIAVILLG
jgi:hypothetical protein